MRKFNNLFFLALTLVSGLLLIGGCAQKSQKFEEENDMYDGPDKAIEFEIERTKDPATGKVPWNKLLDAIQQTQQAKNLARNFPNTISTLSWTERGPYSDAVGPSNGNTRANGGITAGRIRAVMVDSLDPSHKTVWVGGVDGGLWKTTDITTSPANWILVNDYLSNLAVSAICQDPRPGFQNTMYFCTGESFSNADAVRGVGVFKSTDAGATWNYLPSTSSYVSCTRILCDFQGNVYLGTRNTGLLRSTNGGTSWTDITPSGIGASVCDIEISSTAGPGRLHVATGIFSTSGYRYTDNPSTVTSGSGWNSSTTPYTSFGQRTEMAVRGNTLYACPDDGSHQVPTVWKSTDGGDNWVATAGQPNNGWASGQGWYSLSCGINPANTNECIVGGLDCHKTTDGGNTWVKISAWVGTSGQYVHADQHNIQWWDGGNKLLFSCDGGVHYSADGGTTIRDRNQGLRLKQFYSIAIHPTTTNYFLAGAQDNGVHQLSQPGLGTSVEVTGGDGMIVAIDQDEPQYQYGSYVYNNYRRSTNNGASWGSVNFGNTGRFVNPFDLDNAGNKFYAADAAGVYRYWSDPHTGSTSVLTSVPSFNGGQVSAVHVSPYTANRVYFGTGSGRIVRVDNADTPSPVDQNITGAGMTGYVNCVVTGSSDQNLLACFSNYGIMNVWISNNGGTSWTGIDGNLPDMPVRWALFNPDDNSKAYIATETGVWETDLINGASTVWTPSNSFPTVRTDMIKYRSSDRTIAAGTHGRGVWTATVPTPSGFSFDSPGPVTSACPAPAFMETTLTATFTGGFSNPVTLTAAGNPAGTSVVFGTSPLSPGSPSTTVRLTNTNTLNYGSYTITVTGTASGNPPQNRDIVFTITPGAGPLITSQPSPQTVCQGNPASFTVAASGAISYAWQVSTDGGVTWNPIGGANATVYTIPSAQPSNVGLYRCSVSSQCGFTNSNAVALTVNTAPSISAQPQSITVCAGTNATFNVTAAGTSLTYQWQLSTDGGVTYNDIPGATSPSYTASAVTPAMNGYRYHVVINGACPPSATSIGAILTVVTPPTVSGQPANQTVCAGGNASFTVSGSGTISSYQWQLSTDGGLNYNNVNNGGVYTGATTATLTITGATAGMDGYRYRAVLSNATCATPATSNAGVLTVNTLPNISASPQDATICLGSNNTFSVTASGTGVTYQWQLSTNGGSSYNNIGGANASIYTVSSVTAGMNGYKYQVVVSGTCAAPVTSAAATLTVVLPAAITVQPVNKALCAGDNTSFTATATGAASYQWQVNNGSGFTNVSNGGIYTGATTATLTITGASTSVNGYQYRLQVWNATCNTPVNSNNALLTVHTLPAVGLSAAPWQSLLPGRTTTLTATPSAPTAGSSTVATTWYFNGSLFPNSGNTYIVDVEHVGAYQAKVIETWTDGSVCNNQSPIVTIDITVSDKLFIFPSPNDGRFTVSYYNQSRASSQRWITIFDAMGNLVYERQFQITGAYTLIPINLQSATRGIYIVVVGDANRNRLIDGKVHVR